MLDIRNDKNGLVLVGKKNAVFVPKTFTNRLRFFLASAACNIGYTEELDYIKVESTRRGVYIRDDKETVYLEPNDMYRVINVLGEVTQEVAIKNAIATMETELCKGDIAESFLKNIMKAAEAELCQE